ncbi:hypothetical protein FOA52_008250 [Chlamydomonas sp. UWO 241]|nr:hypothetical protein FOA52_008250 [Chlamydomonas sp. UWO 241]
MCGHTSHVCGRADRVHAADGGKAAAADGGGAAARIAIKRGRDACVCAADGGGAVGRAATECGRVARV